MKLVHDLEPIYNKDSKILILGSFPSVASRSNFYYAHKSNRFWKILEILFNIKLDTIEEKKKFLKEKKIALWDVIYSCEIENSNDASIKNVKPNNIKKLINNSNIKYIFTTGNTAYNLYNKYILKEVEIEAINLPSTSSANARYKLEDLVKEYKQILKVNN